MQGYNRNGGLTIVPMPGHEAMALQVKSLIEAKKSDPERPTSVDISTPSFGVRSNGEPYIRLSKEHVGGHDCYVLCSGPGTYEMLIQLMLTIAYLRGRHACRITLVSGYFPLSRTDKDEGDMEFALAPLFFRLFQTCANGDLNRVIVPDPHSPQLVMAGGPGEITPISLTRRLFCKALKDAGEADYNRICVLFPDDGASKNFGPAVDKAIKDAGLPELPVFTAYKRRTSSTDSRMLGLVPSEPEYTADLKGALVLSIDDEINTGGTNNNTAIVMKDRYGAGAFWALATHAVFGDDGPSKLGGPQSRVDRVYVTDTIPIEPRRDRLQPILDRLHVVSWAHDLANIIRSDHWDVNIRGER